MIKEKVKAIISRIQKWWGKRIIKAWYDDIKKQATDRWKLIKDKLHLSDIITLVLLLLIVIAFCLAVCFGFNLLPGESSGFWDGLDRVGNLTGVITLIVAGISFPKLLRNTDSHKPNEELKQNEADDETYDVLLRVQNQSLDTANKDDFIKHCKQRCSYQHRESPRNWLNGSQIHFAEFFLDNNTRGFDSAFHQEVLLGLGENVKTVKRCLEAYEIHPVKIRYGEVAIQQGSDREVLFIDGREPSTVEGERMMEIHFPDNLPSRQDSQADLNRRIAFVAYFTVVMQWMFRHLHKVALCYQGPSGLAPVLGDLADNKHNLEIYQYKKKGYYYKVGSSDPEDLIAEFKDHVL